MADRSIARKIQDDDRATLFAMPEFRRFLFDISDASGICHTSREEQIVLFLEGKRSLGLEILGWFATDGADLFDVIDVALQARKQFTRRKLND